MNQLQSEMLFDAKPLNVFTVSEISQSLKRHVETTFARVRVKGEISALKIHTSGHMYYTLKDQDAVIDAVSWRGAPLGIKLQDGLEIIATGKLTTYPGRSKYQMVIDRAEVSGEGALLKLLQDRKVAFHKEGLFSKKRALPLFPKRIGVITSPTGAVIRDILHRLQDRYPCHVMVWPVLVQGPGAADQVAKAVTGFNDMPLENRPDLIIVARGGGSLEDLWSFNEEIVVRAVYGSDIPTISAIGHETDVTLIDYAADVRAPTPTAAAEIATPVLSELSLKIDGIGTRIKQLSLQCLKVSQLSLNASVAKLPKPQEIIFEKSQRLDDWFERLSILKNRFLLSHQQRLVHCAERLSFPKHILTEKHHKVTTAYQGLLTVVEKTLSHKNQELDLMALQLQNNSYNDIMKKGFSLVIGDDGHVINSVSNIKSQQKMTLKMHDGFVVGEFLKKTLP
jgi:exodeoxyribonuclease VII large subunit